MGYRRLQCPSRYRTASIIPYFIFGDPLFRILSFASLTIDIIENKRVPGGPALYYSLASRFLETNLYCIGFKPRGYVWYEPRGIFFVGDGPVFRHVYLGDERLSWIVSKPGKVEFKTILGGVGIRNFDAVLIGPIFGEFPSKLIGYMSELRKVVAVDISGYIRISKNEKIQYRMLTKSDELEINKAHFLHISQEEYGYIGEARAKIATLLTLGSKGCIMLAGHKKIYVPAYSVFGNATGAGDFFLYVFVVEWLKNRDLVEACVTASAATSLLVDGTIPRDPSKIKSREEYTKALMDRKNYIKNGIKEVGDDIWMYLRQ